MSMKHPSLRGAVLAVLLSLAPSLIHAQDSLSRLRARVNHIVVIYQENWSFDALYGHFPGANGTANASPVSLMQVDKTGAPLAAAPLPLNGKDVDPSFAAVPLRPFDLSAFIDRRRRPETSCTASTRSSSRSTAAGWTSSSPGATTAGSS
jgi:phospholipase C